MFKVVVQAKEYWLTSGKRECLGCAAEKQPSLCHRLLDKADCKDGQIWKQTATFERVPQASFKENVCEGCRGDLPADSKSICADLGLCTVGMRDYIWIRKI